MPGLIESLVHLPTDFKNPFLKNKVDRIIIEIHKQDGYFHKQPVSAKVWFENGNTTGLQTIEGQDLVSVVGKIETFLKTL